MENRKLQKNLEKIWEKREIRGTYLYFYFFPIFFPIFFLVLSYFFPVFSAFIILTISKTQEVLAIERHGH